MQIFFRFVLCTLFVCICSREQCYSQQVDTISSVHNLAEVEIQSAVVDKKLSSGVPQQGFTAVDIERLALTNVADAMKRMAGVQVQDYGGLGGLKSVSIRGLGAKHTALSYDGVPVNDAQSGQIDIGRFSLDNVELVSLVTGQGNDIFVSARSFASAGVIDVVAKRPVATNSNVKIFGGSYGFKGATLVRNRIIDKSWSYSAVLNMQQAEGDYPFTLINGAYTSKEHRVNGDVKNISVEGNIFGDLGDKGKLDVKLYMYNSERGLPGSVKLYNTDNRERLWEDNFFVQASYKVPLSGFFMFRASAKYNYSFSRYIDINKNYSRGSMEDKNRQNEFYSSLGVKYLPTERWSFVLTGDISRTALANNFANSKSPVRINLQTAFAAQYESKSFIATATLLGTFLADKLKKSPSPVDKKEVSPAVALSWQPFTAVPMRLRASVKEVFRAPTLADLYYLRMGNVGLKPERAMQYNVGATYSGLFFEKLNLSVSLDCYHNYVKDKIVALPTMYIWRMQNYGKVEIKGVDATVALQTALPWDMELMFDASYSYISAVDKSKRTSNNYGHQIPYTPKNTLNASITLNNRWLNISYLITAVGERFMLPQNTPANSIPSYVEHTISVNREFSIWRDAKLRLQGDALNFANENYEVIRYYPMPGRQWRLSATVLF